MKPSVLIYGLLVISVLFTTCKKSDTNASSETNFTTYSLGITNENIKLLQGPHIISITVPESIDVFSASANWWPFAIIVGKKNEPCDALRLQQQYLRTTKIPVKGRF